MDEVCAVKVIRGDVATDIEHSRLLLAEGVVASRFRHPSAVRVLEVDRAGAEPFVAMDYVAGQTLAALLQREASQGSVLPPSLVALIGSEIAAAVFEAAQRAWSVSGTGPMVHGGLSPRSVLIDYDGHVRVLGLGGGRARLHLPVPKSRMAYVAPEVWLGATPGRRLDLFALGAMLHDAFTGQRLFRRATDAETRSAIVSEPMPDVARVLAPIDAAISDLVVAMLDRNPDRRPRDAEEVESALSLLIGDREEARSALVTRIDRGFREERDAQRRVVDAAVRRGGSTPGRSPSSIIREASTDGRPARAPSSTGRPAPSARPAPPPPDPAPPTVPPSAPIPSTGGFPMIARPASARPAPAVTLGGPEDVTAGLPAVRMPPPLREPPQRAPSGGPSAFEELLPELLSGAAPVLAEREADIETMDLPDRAQKAPGDRISAIPLVRRSSKPDRAQQLLSEEQTWDGVLETPPNLPPWSAAAAAQRTLEVGSTPASREGVRLAEAEGSLQEILDGPKEPIISDPGGPGVSRYRRSTLLNVSELASVYLAGDAVLGRTVALKVSDIGDEESARFDRDTRIKVLRREARLAAGLFHPRLPVLLDAGRDGEVYFLAYQLIEGANLDRVVAERGAMTPPAVRVVMRDLADAVAHLHGRGLAHADLSPANVLIEPDGRARLVDFSMITSAASPHPLGGELDVAAEALSLGRLGLWMLAGGVRAVEASRLDPELAAILARLMDPDRERRWTDMPAVKRALDALIEGGTSRPMRSDRSLPASPLDARERPGAPLGITYEALAATLEAHFRRASGFDAPDRDPSGPLARAISRRLGLGAEGEAASAILLAARSLSTRFELKPRLAVAEGLMAPVLGARLLELEERLLGARAPDPEPTPLEVATVVEAYAQATVVEEGRRVSPRRAVLALRERADEGRFDGRVVEALIDHLRTTISALEIAPRERILLVGMAPDGPIGALASARGHPVDVVADAEAGLARAAAKRPWGVIADKVPGRRLVDRLPAEIPLVLVGGGAEDTLDEDAPPPARADSLPAGAAPERVLAALSARARSR